MKMMKALFLLLAAALAPCVLAACSSSADDDDDDYEWVLSDPGFYYTYDGSGNFLITADDTEYHNYGSADYAITYLQKADQLQLPTTKYPMATLAFKTVSKGVPSNIYLTMTWEVTIDGVTERFTAYSNAPDESYFAEGHYCFHWADWNLLGASGKTADCSIYVEGGGYRTNTLTFTIGWK